MQQSRRRQPNLGVMLLLYQIFGVIGIDRIPPITLGSIGLQIAIFLRLFKLPWYKPSQVCVSAYHIWTKKEYSRLIFGALEHGDDWHLYYNMLSFAMKGQSLERRYGSVKFAYILGVFTVLSNMVLVALNILAKEYIDEYADHCSVGFSGVIFALKVLTTYYDSNYTSSIMGLPLIVPRRYAVWVELVLIQLFVPNASFYGHLAGIIVGMAYVKGPLKFIMDSLYSLLKSILFSSPSAARFPPQSGPSGYSSTRANYEQHVPPGFFSQTGASSQQSAPRESYSHYVPPGMSEEEQLRRAMEESLHENTAPNAPPYPSGPFSASPPGPGFVFGDNPRSPPPPGFSPDIEDLRNKRQAHFKYNTN